MKRRLFKLALFLLLGAIVNIAVAWGCAAWVDYNTGEHYSFEDNEGYWVVQKGSGLGLIVVFSRWLEELGTEKGGRPSLGVENHLPKWSLRAQVDSITGKTVETQRIDIAAGWPYLAWAGQTTVRSELDQSLTKTLSISEHVSGIKLSQIGPAVENRLLPFKPLWPEVCFNSIFYAAMLWLLWSSPFTARRMIRSKRGRCLKCGYDLRGAEHDVCPECGEELSAKAKS